MNEGTGRNQKMPTSIREMAACMRKSTEPYWISGIFFRPWTVYLSAVLAKIGLSPNVITLISGVVLALGAWCLAIDHPVAWATGGVLVLLYFVLDHCDGEVARFRATVSKRTGGPEGIFWDGVAHGLKPLLIVAIGYRLTAEGSFGWWPMVLVAIGATAACIVPWQRACESALAWAEQSSRKGDFLLIHASLLGNGVHDTSTTSPLRSMYQNIKQLILFPGTFVTLPIAAFLDVATAPIVLSGDASADPDSVSFYWVSLWLVQVAVGNTAAAMNSSLRYASRLRHLESVHLESASDDSARNAT